MISGGKAFQWPIVLGKNEYFLQQQQQTFIRCKASGPCKEYIQLQTF
jgi:hypothetical protein